MPTEPSEWARETADDEFVPHYGCEYASRGYDPCPISREVKSKWCEGCRLNLEERDDQARALDAARAKGAEDERERSQVAHRVAKAVFGLVASDIEIDVPIEQVAVWDQLIASMREYAAAIRGPAESDAAPPFQRPREP